MALNTDDLAEYRKLWVVLQSQAITNLRRSQANVLAVAERQKLEGIRREQKAARSAVAAVREKLEVFERKRAALLEQTSDLQERDQTVKFKLRKETYRIDDRQGRIAQEGKARDQGRARQSSG